MRKAAFYLVASVIGIQLIMLAAIAAGCFFVNSNVKCSGDRITSLLSKIMTEVFALYAAEK